MTLFGSRVVRRRFIDALWDQVKKAGDENVRAIGFGIGLKEDSIDHSRPYCLRAYVTKKRTTGGRAKVKYDFSESVTVEMYPDWLGMPPGTAIDRPITLTLPTDVVEVGDLVATGRVVKADDGSGDVTTGTVVRWRVLGEEAPSWGVLTVAHGFRSDASPVQRDDVTIVDRGSGATCRGERVQEFRASTSGIDVSLIQVRPDLLIRAGLIRSVQMRRLRVPTFDSLASSGGKVGVVPEESGIAKAFTVVGTVESEIVNGVGIVIDLIHCRSSAPIFTKGRSGVPFCLASFGTSTLEPVGLQIAADEQTNFTNGYAQSLETSLVGVTGRMNETLAMIGKCLVGGIEVVRVF